MDLEISSKIDEQKVISKPSGKSAQHCIEPFGMPSSKSAQKKLNGVCKKNENKYANSRGVT